MTKCIKTIIVTYYFITGYTKDLRKNIVDIRLVCRRMSDVVEYVGEWWLPENPENKIHGKLRYDPRKSPILSLDGVFDENADACMHAGKMQGFPMITRQPL